MKLGMVMDIDERNLFERTCSCCVHACAYGTLWVMPPVVRRDLKIQFEIMES
jgi:hypothetical protein